MPPSDRVATGYAEVRPELTKDFKGDLDKKFQQVISSLKVKALEVDPGAIDVSKMAGRITQGVESLKVKVPSMEVVVDRLDLTAKSVDATGGKQLGKDIGENVAEAATDSNVSGKWASRLSSLLGGMAVGGGVVLAGALGLGTAVAGAMAKGLTESIDREKISDKVAVGLGLKGPFADGIKAEVSSIYGGAFGESMADVGDAVTQVRRGLKGLASGDEVESITQQALTLRDVFGADVSETVRSASALVRNGLAPDVQTALDLITTGFQRGADQGGEFLDTLNEYAQPMKDLGLSGEQFVGSLLTAADKGVWSVDKVGDAFKELQIRAIDGSTLTADSLKAMGLQGQGIEGMFARGGEEAKRAMGIVVRSLKGMGDPLKQDAAGVGLFGTMWEDIGKDVLLAMDPATLAVENFAGAGKDAATQAGDNLGGIIEGWKRNAQTKLADFADSTIAPAARRIADAFNRDGFAGAFSEAKDIGSEAWAKIQPGLVELAGNARRWFDDHKGEIATPIQGWLKSGVEGATTAGGWLLDRLGEWLPMIGDWVTGTAVPYVEAHWGEWWDAFSGWIGGLWEQWQTHLGPMQEKVGGWITGTFVPWLQGKSAEWGMALLRWIGEQGWNWMRDRITAVWDGLKGWIVALPGQIASVAGDFWGWLAESFKNTLNRIIGWWNDLSFDTPTIEVAGRTLMESRRIDMPDVAPIMHSGGIFRAPHGQREGYAWLEDGERVIPRGGTTGAATTINVYGANDDRKLAARVQRQNRRVTRERKGGTP